MTKNVEQKSKIGSAAATEVYGIISHKPDIQLCYDFVISIAKALPADESERLLARLKNAPTKEETAKLAVEVATDRQVVLRALSISNNHWEEVNQVSKDVVKRDLQGVLALLIPK